MREPAGRPDGYKAVVTELFQRWSEGDRSGLFALIDENVVWTLAGTCPGGGTHHGKEAFLEASARPLHQRLAASPIPQVDRIIADAETVVVQWHGVGETRGGRTYANQYCWVLRFADGRIVEVTSYLDTLAVARVFDEEGS